jgi:hypothetical protein
LPGLPISKIRAHYKRAASAEMQRAQRAAQQAASTTRHTTHTHTLFAASQS